MFSFGRIGNLLSKADGKVEADKKDAKLLTKETVFSLDNDGASIVEMGGRDDTHVIVNDFIDQRTRIEEYREIARLPDVKSGITDIVNDMVACDETEEIVSLVLDGCEDISKPTRELIREEFDNVLRLINFNDKSQSLVRKWFVDGRLYAHCVVNEGRLTNGIQKVVFLDSRCTRLVEKRKIETDEHGVERILARERVVVYNPSILTQKQRRSTTGNTYRQMNAIQLPEDVVAIAMADEYNACGMQVGHLDTVVKPANDLRNLEDAAVIYRLVNAPERRVYYIDTGNLAKKSAEELVTKVRNKFRTKISYDSTNGKVKSDTQFLTMTDAIWLPRREGSTGTTVDTLQGGQQLGEIEDIIYFRKKLKEAMQVPKGRSEEGATINIGGSDDFMSTEELKFHNLIVQYRTEFNQLLKGLLKRQLILKRICTKKDWDLLIEPFIKIDYAAESAVKAQIDAQKILDRVGNLSEIEPYVGSIFSRKYVLTRILHMTEEEIDNMQKEIEEERKAGVYPSEDADDPSGLGNGGMNPMKPEWGQ